MHALQASVALPLLSWRVRRSGLHVLIQIFHVIDVLVRTMHAMAIDKPSNKIRD